jgi:hypothetical protein
MPISNIQGFSVARAASLSRADSARAATEVGAERVTGPNPSILFSVSARISFIYKPLKESVSLPQKNDFF